MEAKSYSETSLPTRLHGIKHQETVINRLYDRGLNAAHAIRHQETLLHTKANKEAWLHNIRVNRLQLLHLYIPEGGS